MLLRVNTISHSGTIFIEEAVLEMFMIVKYGGMIMCLVYLVFST